MSENSFESFPSQPVIPETPETAHSGFRIGQKVDFNTEIPYGEGETGEAIDTGGGWEIKDFVSRTAGDRVIESAKVVSLNGLHEDIISLTLLHGLPEAEEPTAPSAESAPEEFQLSTRLQPDATPATIVEPYELSPETVKPTIEQPTTPERKEFHTGDSVKVLNAATKQLEDGWVVGVVVANDMFPAGGTVTVVHETNHEPRNVTIDELTAWNSGGESIPSPVTDSATAVAESTPSPEAVPEQAETPAPAATIELWQDKEKTKPTPEAIQLWTRELLAAYDAGDRPQFLPWKLREVARAYGFSTKAINASTPVVLLESIKAKMKQAEVVTPEPSPEPVAEPVIVTPEVTEAAAPETESSAEVEVPFHDKQQVNCRWSDGTVETDWVIHNPKNLWNEYIIIKKADGSNMRFVTLAELTEWNSSVPPATPDTLQPETNEPKTETSKKQEKVTAEKYSPEWIQQTLSLYSIDASKLAGFDQLTPGQQALAVENFQTVMLDEVEQRGREGLANNNSFGLVGKIWRAAFKGVYLAKHKQAALAELERNPAEMNTAILQQSIEGLRQQNATIEVKDGALTFNYLTPELLGLEGELSIRQQQVIEQFNASANDLASIPEEWRQTGSSKQKAEYQKEFEKFNKYSDELLTELSKTKDAPAVELALLQANRNLQLQRQLTSHPEVEKALLNVRSPKLWVEGLKSYVAEGGLYAAGGAGARFAATSALGTLGAAGMVFAAPVIGALRARDRARSSLVERDRLARKGKKDTSNQAATIQDVAQTTADYRTSLMKEQQQLEQLFQNVTAPEQQSEIQQRLNYITEQLATPATVELAGGKGGLVTKLDELKQRLETETDPKKRADLKARLLRRINYTTYKLDQGLVNFGTSDQRVLNHYHLMNTLGEASASAHDFTNKLELPIAEFAQRKIRHQEISDRLDKFLKSQLNITDKLRKDYVKKEMTKGAVTAFAFSASGYLLTHYAHLARPEWLPKWLSPKHQQDNAADLGHLRSSGAPIHDGVVQTASYHPTEAVPQEAVPTPTPTTEHIAEHLTETAQRGDTVWKLTERQLTEQFKDKFSGLNEAQKTYLVDAIKDKIQAHPEQFGLQAGQSIDHIQVGQTINFDSIMKDHAITDLIFKHAQELRPEEMAHIVQNNEVLHHWIINNPHEALTVENVGSILDGTHQLGLSPETLDSIVQEGNKLLSVDYELPPTTVNSLINEVLYGHPRGQEALMAQVKEALQGTSYLETIEKAQHYDAGQMTAGWLKTERGQDWLDQHNGDIWRQGDHTYTVIQEQATTAKRVAEKATETAENVFETIGLDIKNPELVTSTLETVGRKTAMWGIYRVK